MPRRRSFAIDGLLLTSAVAYCGCSSPSADVPKKPAVIVSKLPVAFAQHTFDPGAPPADMPPLREGEEAECDSNFVSNATVSGESKKIDATHAAVTVTQVRITLELKINTWVPAGATQHVIEHELGHRQISEAYYQTADKIAEQIAGPYIGKQVTVTGSDLSAEAGKALQQFSAEITAQYNDKLTPGPAQQRYEDLTDHGRNTVDGKDAVARVLREVGPGS